MSRPPSPPRRRPLPVAVTGGKPLPSTVAPTSPHWGSSSNINPPRGPPAPAGSPLLSAGVMNSSQSSQSARLPPNPNNRPPPINGRPNSPTTNAMTNASIRTNYPPHAKVPSRAGSPPPAVHWVSRLQVLTPTTASGEHQGPASPSRGGDYAAGGIAKNGKPAGVGYGQPQRSVSFAGNLARGSPREAAGTSYRNSPPLRRPQPAQISTTVSDRSAVVGAQPAGHSSSLFSLTSSTAEPPKTSDVTLVYAANESSGKVSSPARVGSTTSSSSFSAPPPSSSFSFSVLLCGRDAAPFAQWMEQQSDGKSLSVEVSYQLKQLFAAFLKGFPTSSDLIKAEVVEVANGFITIEGVVGLSTPNKALVREAITVVSKALLDGSPIIGSLNAAISAADVPTRTVVGAVAVPPASSLQQHPHILEHLVLSKAFVNDVMVFPALAQQGAAKQTTSQSPSRWSGGASTLSTVYAYGGGVSLGPYANAGSAVSDNRSISASLSPAPSVTEYRGQSQLYLGHMAPRVPFPSTSSGHGTRRLMAPSRDEVVYGERVWPEI